jgi:phasin
MASGPKKAPAARAPVETPAFVETPAPIETPAPVETTDYVETIAPVEAPAFVEAPAPVSAAPVFVEAAAAVAPAAPPEAAKMFEVPVKSMTEVQEKVRALIEKGISETRANFSKAKSAADEANSALEASFTTAKTGVAEINAKALEALRASADANFDFVKSVLGVKSVSDFVTLHSEFARKQFETLTGQTKELTALAQKIATESAEPIKTQVAKTFKIAV